MDMTYDIRCPKCNKLLMKYKTLKYDPDKIRGQVVLVCGFDDYFCFDGDSEPNVRVSDDTVVYGKLVKYRGLWSVVRPATVGRLGFLKRLVNKLIKLFSSEEFVEWGFNVLCSRCKTLINIKTIPSNWCEVEINGKKTVVPLNVKILVNKVIKSPNEAKAQAVR